MALNNSTKFALTRWTANPLRGLTAICFNRVCQAWYLTSQVQVLMGIGVRSCKATFDGALKDLTPIS